MANNEDELIYGALNTSLRVKETLLLKQEDYDRLLDAKDYDEALNLLMNTPYREGVTQARQTHDYEAMLMDELITTYHWIKETNPDHRLYTAITLKYVYHNIKVLFKERLNGEQYPEAIINISPVPLYELRQAVNEGQGEQFADYFMGNLENLRNYFDSVEHYTDLDIFIDRAFMHHLKRLSEEMVDPQVRTFFEKYIDETNVLIFFRALRLGHSPRDLQAILTDEGILKVADFVAIAEMGEQAAVRYFSAQPNYRHLFEDTSRDTGKLVISDLEKAVDISLLKELSQANFKVFGPLPLVFYIERKEMEVQQLRLILAGKLNNIDTNIVRDRMRQKYAI